MTQQLQTADGRATLPRELGEFLIELSIGVHRYAMYPASHPSLSPVVGRILGRLAAVFVDRRTLSIGVAQRQLVIDGVATDPGHPVLSDLSRRLHDHRLAAVAFVEGIRADEVEAFLRTVALETERGAEPVGLQPADEIPSWPHVHLHPLGYDELVLSADDDDGAPDRADRLWLDLARSALSLDSAEEPEEVGDPGRLARAMGERSDAEYDQVIARYLRNLAEELRGGSTRAAGKVRRRVADLIEELDEETLDRLLRRGGGPVERQRFLLDANHALSVDAVLKVLKATARSSEQHISHSLTRMLTKLAAHAGEGPDRLRGQADTALRENVEELIRGWGLEDPNPGQYTALLDHMARTSPALHPADGNGGDPGAAERILDMSLEIDAFGPTVEAAVTQLLEGGRGSFLIDRMVSVGEGHRAGARIRSYLATPRHLQRLLVGEDVDEEVLLRLVTSMGEDAVEPLLDVLVESDSRAVRRKVFDALATLGAEVSHRAVSRLDDGRWYVVRNMLALLHRVGTVPRDFDPVRYTWFEDRRVRREALALAMRDGRLRDWALAEALSDEDERLVRIALMEIRERVPETVVPILVNRVVRGDRSSEIRALGALALGNSRSPLARETLLRLASGGRSLFGRTERTPEGLQALEVLRRVWADEPEVQRVLASARRSKDPAIRAAAGAES